MDKQVELYTLAMAAGDIEYAKYVATARMRYVDIARRIAFYTS